MGIISVLLGLIIAAGITFGAFEYFHSATDSNRVTQTQQAIEEVGAGVQNLYVGSRDYTDLTTGVVLNAGLVPKSFIQGSSLITPWNTASSNSNITVGPSDSDSSQFTVTVSGLPVKDCIALGSDFLNSDGVSVGANGTEAKAASDLSTGCAQTSPSTLTVTFS